MTASEQLPVARRGRRSSSGRAAGVVTVALLAGAVLTAPLLTPSLTPSAQAACASPTTRAISGTVFGQDGRDVNVSVGVDLVDRAGRALNAEPGSPSYGCAKTGGYSVPQIYLNHFVGPNGVAPGTLMQDGTRSSRAWRVGSVPSNAVGAYVEVYHRGYLGSPCRDSRGNYCFNPQTLSRYGNANKHLVPVGTANLPVRLPLTCAAKGTAGSISGTVTDRAGRPVALTSLYAWTETKWNAPPFVHGWGIARFSRTGVYSVPALASGQRYVMWATTTGGAVLKKTGVLVSACAATTVNWRV